ncbi:lipoprotein [Pilimelia terevasa]|uniref:Lipoprotein n=1 Tax=Pilimelia terevasa TaxID=53372 RepID=A0A8J3BHW7_9ACTN|nr:iron uptake system protein EfeO [Pilimelia terevasa]GGK15424.1 lipoprotein [Pilimelia terevasa]
MRATRTLALLAAGALLPAAAAGCGGDDRPAASGGAIAVTSTDGGCEIARTDAPAGTVVFSVANKGAKVTEFYVLAGADKVAGEVENIAPGLTRELRVELAAGAYQTACKPGMVGDGIRGAFTVTAAGAGPAVDPELTAAVARYRAYVKGQTAALLTLTTQFVAAVKGGRITEAKALFPKAREPWERIEPVAEIFGDLDPRIDAREADLEPGQAFTGFHKLEKDLWVTKSVAGSGPTADQLMADIKEIAAKAEAEALTPLQLANGAKELLDEVATGKITGEEDFFSHTDLWDFKANLDGSRAAVEALRPVLVARDPALVAQLDAAFAAASAALDRHRAGTGWKLHNQLTKADLKLLSDAINSLGEPVSRVAAAVSR